MHNIVGPDFDRRYIEVKHANKVGLAMSGGLDSFVLYHWLISNNIVPTIFNIKREDGFDRSDRVRDLTGRDDIIVIDESTKKHDERISNGLSEMQEQVDILYTGINHAPPLEHFPQFDVRDRPLRPWRISMEGNHKTYAPFLHLYKYHIVSLGKSLGIDMKKTQSCLVQHNSHCGKCFQCLERQWGFDLS